MIRNLINIRNSGAASKIGMQLEMSKLKEHRIKKNALLLYLPDYANKISLLPDPKINFHL